jgi:DNA-binding PadR family transcriptional regulator
MREFTLNNTLTTHEFYVLLALTTKTLHGYGVRDQVAHDSESSLIMAPGTTYALLKRLVGKSLIERVDTPDRSDIACRYRITELGRRMLKSEITRLERVTKHAQYKLAGKITIP